MRTAVKKLTVRQRIQFGFALVVAIMLLMALTAFERLGKVEHSTDQLLADALPGMYHLTQMRAGWTELYQSIAEPITVMHNSQLDAAALNQIRQLDERVQASAKAYQDTIHQINDQRSMDRFLAIKAQFDQSQQQAVAALQ